MTIWLIFALMTAAAIFAVLWPLARARLASNSGNDIAVYEDQLHEIGRDHAAGLIGDKEADAARVEISRRLIAAADALVDEAAQSPAIALWRRRTVGVTALILLPIAAAMLYLRLGSPGLADYPLSVRLDAPMETRSIDSMLAQVESHLDRNPEDGLGWQVVAPVYLRLGRVDDAVKARRNALRLLGANAEREADLGEALVVAANGIVTQEAKGAFDRALRQDPKSLKPRFFIGLAAEQDGKREAAAETWRGLIHDAPAGAPWIDFVKQALARVEGHDPGQNNAGPSSEDIATADDLNPQQQSAMIHEMVERLAKRLAREGSDFEGWLRLVRAYTVLGEHDKARSAAADARRAFTNEPDKIQRLDELTKMLGLGG